jgi:hypothetical protein
MVNLSDRQRMRQELVAQGFSWEYVDEWQPKTTLYRHAPGLNIQGNEVFPVGSAIKGVPGSPDYVLRKARLGMFPYPPADTCECRWCVARKVNVEVSTEPEKAEPEEFVVCQDCGEKVHALTKAGALSRLRVHMKTHQGTQDLEPAQTSDL